MAGGWLATRPATGSTVGTKRETGYVHALDNADGSVWLGGQVVANDGTTATVHLFRVGSRTVPAADIVAAGLSADVGGPIVVKLAANSATVLDVRAGQWIGGGADAFQRDGARGARASVLAGERHYAAFDPENF